MYFKIWALFFVIAWTHLGTLVELWMNDAWKAKFWREWKVWEDYLRAWNLKGGKTTKILSLAFSLLSLLILGFIYFGQEIAFDLDCYLELSLEAQGAFELIFHCVHIFFFPYFSYFFISSIFVSFFKYSFKDILLVVYCWLFHSFSFF